MDGNEDNKNNEEEETLSHNEEKNDRDLQKMKAQGKPLLVLFKNYFYCNHSTPSKPRIQMIGLLPVL